MGIPGGWVFLMSQVSLYHLTPNPCTISCGEQMMGYLALPITVIFLGGLLWPFQEADVGGRDRINAGKVRKSSWHGAQEVRC